MTHQADQQAVQAVRFLKRGALILFPLLLVLGKLCSFIAPDTYFSYKGNLFNQYFVKLGWFWTTLAFWAPYIAWPTPAPAGLRKPGMRGVVARYVAATVWWIFFSQWFLGAPIMDRIFLMTGGSCTLDSITIESATSSKVCRIQGGQWAGGHDPSGHFFLLMQSAMLLVQENIPYIYYLLTSKRAVVPASFKLTLSLLGLWIWMFFITAVYFHSFTEKLSGLAFALVEILFVYYLGEAHPFGDYFGIRELDIEAVPKEAQPIRATASGYPGYSTGNPDSANSAESVPRTITDNAYGSGSASAVDPALDSILKSATPIEEELFVKID